MLPSWGDVFAIDTCDGLKLRTYDMDDWFIEDALNVQGFDEDDFLVTGYSNKISKDLSYNGNQILSLTDTGFLNYGGVGTQVFYRTGAFTRYVGTDVVSATSWQQYTLLFKEKTMDVFKIDFTETGEFVSEVRETNMNIGLWSKYSYDLYRSGFFFIGSNKRMYGINQISLMPNGLYQVQLESNTELTQWVMGDMQNINPGDQVYLQSTEQNLRIFINGDFRDNGRLHKSKILIFDKDYLFWHKWISCNSVIRGEVDGYYIGDGLYNYC